MGADTPIIVVGVDGSDSGRAALRAGAARSALEHGHLLAVHVTPAMPFWLSYSPFCRVEWNECTTLLAAEARNHTELAATGVNVSWSFHHVGGGIVSGLTAAALASHASLVVVAEGVRHQRPHLCPAHRLARDGLLPVQVVYATNGSAE
ncbi:MAG: universal stress protein [Actinobacteria bacterium]|nr:universal stress protein [Actinomycetota bacterium]